MTKNNHGFTLIELIVTLAVFGIVVAVAAPNVSMFLDSNRRAAQVNTFVSALNLARSEAVKRNNDTTVCIANDAGTDCSTTESWENGWLVFVDGGTTIGTIDGADTILRVYGPIYKRDTPRDVTLKEISPTTSNTVTPANFVTYNARGRANSAITFRRCDDNGATHARAILVAATGRVRLSKDTSADADKIHEVVPGTNIICQ